MPDEDLPTPCNLAGVGALQKSEKKIIVWGISETEIAAVAGRSGVSSRKKDLPIPHHF